MTEPMRAVVDRAWVDPEPLPAVTVWVRNPATSDGVQQVTFEGVREARVMGGGTGYLDVVRADGVRSCYPLVSLLAWEVSA